MNVSDVLAVVAASWGVAMAVSPVLQIRRMLQTRSAEDVSLGYFGILLPGFALWIAYGLSRGDLALVVPNSVALVVTLTTVGIALRLRREAAADVERLAGSDA
ncbi:SemiSWEET family sugar transporter [Actinotalea fermentans]|uniref:Sugar transporter SemiSWEET n=1 Tax=Actinotalea fermentans TaxID=43671 RepID=A0A511YTS7_9CELL|nr:SemiSWEET family transporter [Actinotalea fermentans]KGM17734.1 hypothetical protein N867_13590 [Actinotalea fermentans ATCC 43279 = JCM 9966 = DSM 3133]GEN78597.1 hypothetical protein AFE02nite_03310 [Actinotalea fermentans]